MATFSLRHPASSALISDCLTELDPPFELPWDDVVDVVCIGSGTAGTAAALASCGIGLQTQLVGTAPSWGTDVAGRLGITDPATVEYLNSVTADTPALERRTELPVRFVERAAPAETGFHFAGAAVRNWAADCLAAAGGILTTAVCDPRFTTTVSSGGRRTEVALLGTIDVRRDMTATFDEWIAATARQRGIVADEADVLDRLVFDNGRVVGAVVNTPAGPSAIRTRCGVMLALDSGTGPCAWPTAGLDGVSVAELAIVTRTASRFGRPELLVRTDC